MKPMQYEFKITQIRFSKISVKPPLPLALGLTARTPAFAFNNECKN
jgi:hypothetical protein